MERLDGAFLRICHHCLSQGLCFTQRDFFVTELYPINLALLNFLDDAPNVLAHSFLRALRALPFLGDLLFLMVFLFFFLFLFLFFFLFLFLSLSLFLFRFLFLFLLLHFE